VKSGIIKFLLSALLLSGAPALAVGHNHTFSDERVYTRAAVTDVTVAVIEEGQGIRLQETTIFLKVLDGQLKGQTRRAVFRGENNMPAEMTYRKGDVVFVGISAAASEGTVEAVSLYDKDNTPGIVFICLLLVVSIVIIGRLRGVAALLALIVTIVLLFTMLIPMTLRGYSPLPIAVVISVISIVITLPIIAGLHLKTLCAALGAVCGIVVASLIAIIFSAVLHLSGLITNEMLTVFYIADTSINLKGIMLSGMIIAALGAIMDVCVSIASSTAEIFHANPSISERDALRSVFTIGKDILGSMVNTLILAYVGSSLSLILVIAIRIQPEMPFAMVLNYNPVLSELVKSVTGSLGMFSCIPITAFISVKLYRRKMMREGKIL
jgi:uncharacterized membrane protein